MPFLGKDTIETVNISGRMLDNSKLNKLGNLRLSPLKSYAILFFILTLVLPAAFSKLPDLSLYFNKFSAAKELAQAADASTALNNNISNSPEQEQTEKIKQKKQTLADIWPEEANGEKSASNIIPIAKAAPPEVNAVQPKKQTIANIWTNEAGKEVGQPRRLVIPAIKVSASIESLGIKQSREMEAPKNSMEAGWFNLGPRPGEPGIALIAGHLNNTYGAPAVFWHLSRLKTGDDIYITDETGNIIHFKVSESKIYDANAPLGEFFGTGGSSRLNLITCNGVWDSKEQNYTKRLVVSADLVAE